MDSTITQTMSAAATSAAKRLTSLVRGHKNPAKYLTIQLLEAINSENLENLPEILGKTDEMAVLLQTEELPLNARNPFYSTILSTFNGVARDRIRAARGRLTGKEAIAAEEQFNENSRRSLAEIKRIPYELHKKPHIVKIINLLFNAIIKTKLFYRTLTAPFRRARSAAAAHADAESDRRVAELQAELNRVRRISGGTRRKKRGVRSTRKARS